MIERTFNALFLVVSFTFCLSFITNTEFSQEFAMVEGVVITGYVLMCMIAPATIRFILKRYFRKKDDENGH